MNLMTLFNQNSPESKQFNVAMEALLKLPELVEKIDMLLVENAHLRVQVEILTGKLELESQSKVY